MIWFVMVVAASVATYFLTGRDDYRGLNTCTAAYIGLLLALMINATFSAVLPNKLVTTITSLKGPVVVKYVQDSADGQYQFEYLDKDGYHLIHDNLEKIVPGPANTVAITDYVVFNGWLSMFNYTADQTQITLKTGDTVQVIK